MTLPAPRLRSPAERPPVALHDRAMDDLRYIRETMERSASFTAVSGRGGVAMGLVALVAAGVATQVTGTLPWVGVWMGAAVVSLGLALLAMSRKARAAGTELLAGAGRKFAWNFLPPLLVGAALTVAMVLGGHTTLLPGMWLLLYGVGVVTAGSYSVRAVPAMGVAFLTVGTLALFSPAAWGNAFMAGGFGVLHLLFGGIIWRKHGG